MEDTYVRLINFCLHLFRSSSSTFSSQYLLFLKSSRSCIILLTIPFTSVIFPSIVSWRRQFLLRIWPIQLAFLRSILFRSVLFSYTFKNLFISYFLWQILSSPFSSSTTFQSCPNTSTLIFLVSRSLSYINQCSKHNT